jgi:hypothetical protein
MKTDIRLLTKRDGKKLHYETLLQIDWTGVTQEQLQTLAQWAIMHETQARYAKADHNPPEHDLVIAAELAKSQPQLCLKYTPSPPKIVLSKEYQDLLDRMSPEERKQLEELLV